MEHHSLPDYIAMLGESILRCFERGGKVMLYGNGGFAAIADHIVTELMGRYRRHRPPLPAISLNSNPALISCIANDFGFERVFSRQIEGIARPEDIAIALTTSGNSKNILEGLLACHLTGCESWVLTRRHPAPAITELCENVVAVPSDDTAEIQNIAMQLLHEVCAHIDRQLPLNCGQEFDKALKYAAGGCDTLLLDRDGVVNELLPNAYVTDTAQLSLRAAFERNAVALAEAFPRIFIVTNQKCVGRGTISIEKLDEIHRVLRGLVGNAGGRIDGFFAATDPDLSSDLYKPGIGLMRLLRDKFPDIDPGKCVTVGDSCGDYLFARRAGTNFVYCHD